MFSKKMLWGSLTALMLLTGSSGVTFAEMPAHSSEQTSQFHRIEQPLGLKVGVAIAGLALVGLELWWFLLYKNPDS
jgi:plastocyanin domain-containing protein